MINIETTCKKCGKRLNGLEYTYGSQWICSNCTDDKDSVLYCESDCLVQALHLDYGYNSDINQANEYLKQDEIYTVQKVQVGRSSSEIVLKEFPNVTFNTVHFTRVK